MDIIDIIIGYCFLNIIIFGCIFKRWTVFNPFLNYEEWKMNWFGIIVCTILINIIFTPPAIIYWIYKIIREIYELIYFIFTVGR